MTHEVWNFSKKSERNVALITLDNERKTRLVVKQEHQVSNLNRKYFERRMFARLSMESRRILENQRCTYFGSRIVQSNSVRWESSINFQNNQQLQKQNLKQSKMKGKKLRKKDEMEVDKENVVGKEAVVEGKSDSELVPKAKKVALDYSWLPRVPNTEHLPREEFNSEVLYSGYRPIFVSEKNSKKDNMMQFAMKLEKLSQPVPWVSSATGQEFYSEWDNIPIEVVKDLKPFHPPNVAVQSQNHEQTDAILKREILLREQDKLLKRKRGRKKPILRILELKKKFKLD